MSEIRLTVNGAKRSVNVDDDTPLVWVLRNTLALTGTKFGCGMGVCGSCTILENGKAIRSCQKQMGSVAGLAFTTIEGVSAQGTHAVQKAWAEVNVPQCGYCQPGQIMQAVSLLSTKPHPTDDDIDTVMAGNICRCGTYQRIRAAIKTAAKETA